MARTVGIGIQNFQKIIETDNFYIDKTDFIREWWDSQDDVTLITRPRRFGKTLTLSMVNRFFSNKYHGLSFFNTGNGTDVLGPDKSYHGFVLGLLVELAHSYTIRSNRESGFGRYDVFLIPRIPFLSYKTIIL